MNLTRALLLGGTCAFVAFVLTFALTPFAWYASGRPSESYPELFYIAYGWPAALALVLVAAVHWRKPGHTNVVAEALVWIGTIAIVWLCALLALVTLATMWRVEASGGVFTRVAELNLTNFYALLIVGVVSVLCGVFARTLLTKLNA